MARPAQITQNNKFAKSLLYLKKELRDEGDFLCSWASQFSVNWYCHFWWVLLGTTKVLKITSMQCLKNWVIKLMFCMLISMKVFCKLIALFLMGLARHAQIIWVNLKYLYDILRKKSGMQYYPYNLLYIQCTLTIDPFSLSVWAVCFWAT